MSKGAIIVDWCNIDRYLPAKSDLYLVSGKIEIKDVVGIYWYDKDEGEWYHCRPECNENEEAVEIRVIAWAFLPPPAIIRENH